MSFFTHSYPRVSVLNTFELATDPSDLVLQIRNDHIDQHDMMMIWIHYIILLTSSGRDRTERAVRALQFRLE